MIHNASSPGRHTRRWTLNACAPSIDGRVRVCSDEVVELPDLVVERVFGAAEAEGDDAVAPGDGLHERGIRDPVIARRTTFSIGG